MLHPKEKAVRANSKGNLYPSIQFPNADSPSHAGLGGFGLKYLLNLLFDLGNSLRDGLPYQRMVYPKIKVD